MFWYLPSASSPPAVTKFFPPGLQARHKLVMMVPLKILDDFFQIVRSIVGPGLIRAYG
jgi:hypothetical protein